jgi:hypothetical protein
MEAVGMTLSRHTGVAAIPIGSDAAAASVSTHTLRLTEAD